MTKNTKLSDTKKINTENYKNTFQKGEIAFLFLLCVLLILLFVHLLDSSQEVIPPISPIPGLVRIPDESPQDDPSPPWWWLLLTSLGQGLLTLMNKMYHYFMNAGGAGPTIGGVRLADFANWMLRSSNIVLVAVGGLLAVSYYYRHEIKNYFIDKKLRLQTKMTSFREKFLEKKNQFLVKVKRVYVNNAPRLGLALSLAAGGTAYTLMEENESLVTDEIERTLPERLESSSHTSTELTPESSSLPEGFKWPESKDPRINSVGEPRDLSKGKHPLGSLDPQDAQNAAAQSSSSARPRPLSVQVILNKSMHILELLKLHTKILLSKLISAIKLTSLVVCCQDADKIL